MKQTLKNIALSLGLTFGFAVAAHAQSITSGAAVFNVTTQKAVDLRINGTASADTSDITVDNGTISATNGLAVTITVDDASPKIDDGTLEATVPFGLRSNAVYVLSGSRTINDTTTNNPAFDSSDIRMSFSPVMKRNTGTVASGTDMFTAGWATGARNVGNLPATGSPLQLLTGSRISLQGDNNTNNNFITSNLKFSIKRQYYTAGSFSQTVTLSITAP